MKSQICQRENRSWLNIDLNQIIKNYNIYKNQFNKNTEIMAIMKANAYGHGDIEVSSALQEQGVKLFAVSNIDEAITLRNAGIKGEIVILGYTDPKKSNILYENNITQTIVSKEHALSLIKTNIPIKCQIAIDTGMNRIGLDADNIQECNATIRLVHSKMQLNGIFTHFCVAGSRNIKDIEFTKMQLEKFTKVKNVIEDLNLKYIHCCNSAAGIYFKEYNKMFNGFNDIVRLGISLYGMSPSDEVVLPKGIKPALNWYTVISRVKNISKGESVGYDRAFKAKSDRIIATITTGYADGYSRSLSKKGYVLIHGQKAKIIGKICMDQIMVDVTDINNVKMGDIVTLIGKDNKNVITADDLGKLSDTIGYEIICNISERVQRIYTQK